MTQNFHILAKITEEPPALPPIEHASAHILNAPLFECQFTQVYLLGSRGQLRQPFKYVDSITRLEVSPQNFLQNFFLSDAEIYRLPKAHQDHLQAVYILYNAHMLHSLTVDPFKLALYKLMGKPEPSRSVP
jgi:hypothetical protein